jgi:hypothetical protein
MKGRIIFGENGQPDRFILDKKEVTEAEFREQFPYKPIGDGTGLCGFSPITSDALSVHPKQVKEAMEDAAKKGVPTDFLPDGRPILRTRQHRAEYLKAYGYYDRDAGYSDPAPGSYKGSDVRPKDHEGFIGE